MIWSADSQIKTPKSTPLTSHGPALAASPTRLYMAYIGKDGQNVWWAWTDNQTGNFTDWQGDLQIKLQSTTPLHSSDRPALAFFQNFPVLFTITPGHNDLQCSWFDGNQWHGYSLANLLGNEKGLRVVTAQVFNGQLHLVVITDHGPWFHCVCAADITQPGSWSVPGGPGTGFNHGTLVAHAGSLILIGTNDQSTLPSYFTMNPALPGGSFQQPLAHGIIEPAAGSPKIAPAPGAVSFNGNLTLIYLEQSSHILYAAPAPGLGSGTILLGASVPVRSTSTTAKTRTPPAVVTFQNQLCIAHSGSESDNLFLAYGH